MTEPLKLLLDQDLAIVKNSQFTQSHFRILTEIVNYSTQLFGRCWATADKTPDVHSAPFLVFRHIIEMADASTILIERSCFVPIALHARSALEGLFSLRFILQDDYKIRSLAWLREYAEERISMYKKYDPECAEHKPLKDAFERDELVSTIPGNLIADSTGPVKRMQGVLDADIFKKFRPPFPKELRWYSKCDEEIRNLKQLASAVKMNAHYEAYYGTLSRYSHAKDAESGIMYIEHKGQTFRRLRQKDVTPVDLMRMFAIQAVQVMTNFYRPEEMSAFRKWYKFEVMPLTKSKAGD